jgi:hypothetical protein
MSSALPCDCTRSRQCGLLRGSIDSWRPTIGDIAIDDVAHACVNLALTTMLNSSPRASDTLAYHTRLKGPSMALRSFTDAEGCAWDVWEVHASVNDRRKLGDRRAIPRSTFERRIADFVGWIVAFRRGRSWLVFRSVRGRWRLTPVPLDWERLSDAALYGLVALATRAKDLPHAA